MTKAVHIGLIGLDSSHAPLFTRLLNGFDGADPQVSGGRVVGAFPGDASPDFPLSAERISAVVHEMREDLRVPCFRSIAELAAVCDAFMITSVDSRRRKEQLEGVLEFQKPVFIDKPFALSECEAVGMINAAAEAGVKAWGSSVKRFSPQLIDALKEYGQPDRVEITGPLPRQRAIPHLFWYGVHQAEILYAALGPGCVEIHSRREGAYIEVEGRWYDGRVGRMGGWPEWSRHTAVTLSGRRGSVALTMDSQSHDAAATLLDAVLSMFRGEPTPTPASEITEVCRFLEAANASLRTGLDIAMSGHGCR